MDLTRTTSDNIVAKGKMDNVTMCLKLYLAIVLKKCSILLQVVCCRFVVDLVWERDNKQYLCMVSIFASVSIITLVWKTLYCHPYSCISTNELDFLSNISSKMMSNITHLSSASCLGSCILKSVKSELTNLLELPFS